MSAESQVQELLEKRWHTVEGMLRNSKGMCWDGCHKIYVLMDDAEVEGSLESGYEVVEPDLDKLKGWYEDSCGLRFVNAIFTNRADANAGFVTLVSQFEEDDDE